MAASVEGTRTLKLHAHCPVTRHSCVEIRQGKEADVYHVAELDYQGGRLFAVARKTPGQPVEVYHVVIGGVDAGCDGWGFTRWHHCKHHDALKALINAKRI